MLISDLNHLETVEATQIIGGSRGRKSGENFKKNVDINLDVFSDVDSKVDVEGNAAQGYADAEALGKDTFTDAEAITVAIENKGSKSTATSTSAVD